MRSGWRFVCLVLAVSAYQTKVPPELLQRRPVTEEALGGTTSILQLGSAVSTENTPTPARAEVGVPEGRAPHVNRQSGHRLPEELVVNAVGSLRRERKGRGW